MTLTGVVIGLGNIGQGYDYACGDGSNVLTHAQAFQTHPDFTLVGGIDPDAELRERFVRKFHCPAWESLDAALKEARPDVWAVAVPTALHASVLTKILTVRPKAAICEKPLAHSVDEARAMVMQAQKSGTALLVNYIRRFEPGVLRLKSLLAAGEIGDVYKGVLWYSKGLRHNGSHFLDLMSFFLGPVTDIRLLSPGRPFGEGDFEPDVRLRYGRVDVYVLAGREEDFSRKDFELIGTRGRIQYLRGGEKILVQKTQEQKLFPGCRVLQESGEAIPTDLACYQWHVLEALKEHLTNGTPLASDGNSGLQVMEALDRIERMITEETHE